MKKIGYIYKYSEEDNKGILVYGCWKGRYSNHRNLPLLFDSTDCISKVATGQIVYFQLVNGVPSLIERASLSNFDKELFDSLLTWKDDSQKDDWVLFNTTIEYENLREVEMPTDDYIKYRALNSGKSIDEERAIYSEDLNRRAEARKKRPIRPGYRYVELPERIEYLFECFGKYNHPHRGWFDDYRKIHNDTIIVNLRDLSLWLDPKICQCASSYFGMTFTQAKYLYDVFVLRRYIGKDGITISPELKDDIISTEWFLLLAGMDEQELCKLITCAHRLQPALPVDFCKKHLDLLTDEYGMPDVEICNLFNQYQIFHSTTGKQYNYIKNQLFIYRHCNATHNEGEGVPMCTMSKETIDYLENLLEDQFIRLIKPNICAKIEQVGVFSHLQDNTNTDYSNEELVDFSILLEKCESFTSSELTWNSCKRLVEQYSKLSSRCKEAFKDVFTKLVNDGIVNIVNNQFVDPFLLGDSIEQLGNWIKDETLSIIKPVLNKKYNCLDDLDELRSAFDYGFIIPESFSIQYKEITKKYDADQYTKEINNIRRHKYPSDIQRYIVSRIIDLVRFDSTGSASRYTLDYDLISTYKELLEWFKKQNHYKYIDDDTLIFAGNRIKQYFTKEEAWKLFEDGILLDPGTDNIKQYLDKLYSGEEIKEEFLQKECFQQLLFEDFCESTDEDTKYLIADNLNNDYISKAIVISSGSIKLYLWIKKPTDSFDWSLIKNHFGDLSNEAQIRLLKYIFYQIAIGKLQLSINELYSELAEATRMSSKSTIGVLYLLKSMIENSAFEINSECLEKVIGENNNEKISFLLQIKKILYNCPGYTVFSQYQQETDFLSFNGVLTKECQNNMTYFVIEFYEIPVNIFGKQIEYLDDEFVVKARCTLERNIPAKYIDGKYYIQESFENEVRHFVVDYEIDDKCNLVSDKAKTIELGYLPKSNGYKPQYTNYRRVYEEDDNFVCRCSLFEDIDTKIATPFYDWEQKKPGLPFYWCNQKMCARRAFYFVPVTDWENYRFSDFLFILMGQDLKYKKLILGLTSAVSRFCCIYKDSYKSNQTCHVDKIVEAEEVGTLSESSVLKNIYEEDDEDYQYEDYQHSSTFDDRPTYDRYNGSWAQDEMGYSDDDIDTIFDGDPDAYWNID